MTWSKPRLAASLPRRFGLLLKSSIQACIFVIRNIFDSGLRPSLPFGLSKKKTSPFLQWWRPHGSSLNNCKAQNTAWDELYFLFSAISLPPPANRNSFLLSTDTIQIWRTPIFKDPNIFKKQKTICDSLTTVMADKLSRYVQISNSTNKTDFGYTVRFGIPY